MKRMKLPLCLLILLFFSFHYNPAQGQIRKIGQELRALALLKDSLHIVESLNRLGTLYRTRNADSSFYYGMRAKRTATHIDDEKGKADAELVIAFSLFKKGLYAESLEILGKILPYYEKSNDTEQIIRVFLDMAEVLNKGVAERPKIIALFQKAMDAGKSLEKDSIMSQLYLNYCNRNTSLSRDSIKYYLDKSRKIAYHYKDEYMILFNRVWEARLLILDGQLHKAFPLVKQLIAESQNKGYTNIEINLHFLMVGYEEIDPKLALEHCYKAYEVANRSGDSYIEIYILNNALQVAKKMNDKNEIIKAYAELDKAMSADWEKSRKFMGDYVKYNTIQTNNGILNKKTAQKTIWLITVSFLAVIIILIVYLIMLRQRKKMTEQLLALNETTKMQVIAMEEEKYQAVEEEKRRLGQDLHDGLSSSIAAIKHQLDILLLDTENTGLKVRLTKLQAETERAYAVARGKSHAWLDEADERHEQSFEKYIKSLTDISLPDARYHKTIQIDDYSLVGVTVDTKISLLRIIQGAVTNIIKHAKAKRVDILIYEENDTLFLSIHDDGVGLGLKQLDDKKNVGLQSIRRRAHLLNGDTKIISNSEGTEIIVSIPLAVRE